MIKELHKKPKTPTPSLFRFFSKPDIKQNSSTKINSIMKSNKVDIDITTSSIVKDEIIEISSDVNGSVHIISEQVIKDNTITCVENITTNSTVTLKKADEQKFNNEFDDFDVENVDLLFLSQQRWIERCLEQENAYLASQLPPDSPTNSIPKPVSLPNTPITGKRQRPSVMSQPKKPKQPRLPNFFRRVSQ